MSGEEIDQSSFASILAGVQKMRDQYEPTVPSRSKRPLPSINEDRASSNPVRVEKEAQSAPIQREHLEQIVPLLSKPVEVQPSNELHNITVKNLPSPIPGPSSGNGGSGGSGSSTNRPRQKRSRTSQNVHSYTSIQVAQSQKGNPLLESPLMKITPWSYNGQVLLDYYINATIQVLFLSLKYHKLRPEYVWRRIEKLKGGSSNTDFDLNDEALRVLLVVVDIDSPQDALRNLLVICVKNDLTLVIAWSFEEAGNYIAYLKLNEMARSKVVSSIQGAKKGDYNSHIVDTLTTVRAVNKTDVANLLANCKSFKQIVLASTNEDGLKQIPGLGDRKVQNLKAVFSNPFIFNKETPEE